MINFLFITFETLIDDEPFVRKTVARSVFVTMLDPEHWDYYRVDLFGGIV